MHAGQPIQDDDPGTIAAAVRSLAADAHAALSRAAAGEDGGPGPAVDDVLRRIDDLRRRLDPGRLDGLGRWLDGLQRQALVVQGLGELRGRVDRLEGPGKGPIA